MAKNSLGIQKPEQYPKQIYDIEMLAFNNPHVNETVVKHMEETMVKTVPVEAEFRRMEITPIQVLEDVKRTMDRYSLVDVSIGDVGLKAHINKFHQFFVNATEMNTKMYEWSSRALRIKFLADLIQRQIKEEISTKQVLKTLEDVRGLDSKLKDAEKARVGTLKKELLNMLKIRHPAFKELRGKPLNRVFWQVVTPNNFEKIKGII